MASRYLVESGFSHLQLRFEVISIEINDKKKNSPRTHRKRLLAEKEPMAHHLSAKKRIRQTAKRTLRNRALRSATRRAVKKFRLLLEQEDSENLKTAYPGVQKVIDRAVTKGILHRKTAARYKSRLALEMAKIQAV